MSADRYAALQALNFGEVDSESEPDLTVRFLPTTDFAAFAGGRRVDLLLGPKGSGKSAVFQLFARHQDYARRLAGAGLSDVIIDTGTGFRDITELSTTEIESLRSEPEFDFERLWFLYIALKAAIGVGRAGIESKGVLREFLRQRALARDFRLLPIFKMFWRALMSASPPNTFKVTIRGNIVEIGTRKGELDTLDLLEEVHELVRAKGQRLWLLCDNLDELYSSEPKTRIAALNALFSAVNQIRGRFAAIEPKIFLRTDLWDDLEFNNKSHWVGKELELSWSRAQLLTLMIKRAVVPDPVAEALAEIVPKIADRPRMEGVSLPECQALFYAIFENPVYRDAGGDTFEWMLSRSSDGKAEALPRELITFGNEAAKGQRALGGPPNAALVGRTAIRDAYLQVSRIRCETFLSEFPELRDHFRRFRGKRSARFHREEVKRLMRGLTPSEDRAVEALHEVGVIAPIDGHVSSARFFEVPLLYRHGLGLKLSGGR